MKFVLICCMIALSDSMSDRVISFCMGGPMSRNTYRSDGEGAYVSYGDAFEWQSDFSRAYHCVVEWKLTLRRERDGSLGSYVTAFAKERGGSGSRLLGHQVVRFGKDQDAVTVPAAMVRALILLDRELGGSLDDGDDVETSADPAQPL